MSPERPAKTVHVEMPGHQKPVAAPADEVKQHQLESNISKLHLIISFLQKVAVLLNCVTRSRTCTLSVSYSTVCFQFSSCFVGGFFWGGEYSCEEMRAIEGVYVPGSYRGFLMCNTGHFGIQMPGAIL